MEFKDIEEIIIKYKYYDDIEKEIKTHDFIHFIKEVEEKNIPNILDKFSANEFDNLYELHIECSHNRAILDGIIKGIKTTIALTRLDNIQLNEFSLLQNKAESILFKLDIFINVIGNATFSNRIKREIGFTETKSEEIKVVLKELETKYEEAIEKIKKMEKETRELQNTMLFRMMYVVGMFTAMFSVVSVSSNILSNVYPFNHNIYDNNFWAYFISIVTPVGLTIFSIYMVFRLIRIFVVSFSKKEEKPDKKIKNLKIALLVLVIAIISVFIYNFIVPMLIKYLN